MNRLKKQIDYAKFTENSIVCLDIDYAERLLLELIKQYESPTLEQVKKEWEAKGYNWEETEEKIILDNKEEYISIIIRIKERYFYAILGKKWKQFSRISISIPFELHQLLTKTFKALGWLDA